MGDLSSKNIENIFKGKKLESTIRFLDDSSIDSIEQITDEIIINYCGVRGVGISIIRRFKELLIKIYMNKADEWELNYNIHSVDFWFSTSTFDEFREYCKNLDIRFVLDINNEFLEEYKKEYRVRAVTFKQIVKGLDDYHIYKTNALLYVDKNSIDENSFSEEKIKGDALKKIERPFILDGDYALMYKEYRLNYIFEMLGKDICLEKEKNIFVKQLEETGLDNLGLLEYKEEIKSVVKILNTLKSIDKAFIDIDILLSSSEKSILEMKYKDEKSIIEIAKELGVTRQAIDQKLKRFSDKVIRYFKSEDIKLVLTLTFNMKIVCPLSKILERIGEERQHYFKILIDKKAIIHMQKQLELIYFDKFENVGEVLNNVIEKLPKTFKINNYAEFINEKVEEIGLKYEGLESLQLFLKSFSLKVYGEYASKQVLNNTHIVSLIFEEYIKKPIRYDEYGFEYLNKLAKEHFGVTLGTSIRSIEARIRDNSEILLVDRSTFIHISNFDFNRSIIEKIDDILVSIFTDKELVNIKSIFDDNHELFVENGIETKYALYAVILYYFGDEYTIGKGNTLNIYKNASAKKITREMVLENLIKEKGYALSRAEIKKITGMSDFQIDDTIQYSKTLIKINGEIGKFEFLNMTDIEVVELKNIITGLLNEYGYVVTYAVFKAMKSNELLTNFIERNNIVDNESIAAIIKKVDKDIMGHTKFLYKETSKYRSIEELIRDKFRGTILKDEIISFINSNGYREISSKLMLGKIIDDGSFIQISKDYLVHKNNYSIGSAVEQFVVEYIDKNLGENDYIILNNLNDYDKHLPSIEYEWNPCLIKEILTKNNFRYLKRIYDDGKNERFIIVRSDSKFETYADLIFDIIKNKYQGELKEEKIYDFLTTYKVVSTKEYSYDKKLPYDLKVIGRIEIDEDFNVKII